MSQTPRSKCSNRTIEPLKFGVGCVAKDPKRHMSKEEIRRLNALANRLVMKKSENESKGKMKPFLPYLKANSQLGRAVLKKEKLFNQDTMRSHFMDQLIKRDRIELRVRALHNHAFTK